MTREQQLETLKKMRNDVCEDSEDDQALCYAIRVIENAERTGESAQNVSNGDSIAKKAAIDKFIDGLEEIFADLRERHGDDSVCGLCEYDGAYLGQSGDWCNECPGFEKDDCFKLSGKIRKKWADEIIKALLAAQPETDQIRWERDTAIQQLKDLGYGLGEKPRTDGDAISRRAVSDMVRTWSYNFCDLEDEWAALKEIRDLPSVHPKLPENWWKTDHGYMWLCPHCGLPVHSDFEECLRCGIKRPSVQPEIIRCKDCIYQTESWSGINYCEAHGDHIGKDNDYCSNARRKYWDDAFDVEAENVSEIKYSDRFPKPEWCE